MSRSLDPDRPFTVDLALTEEERATAFELVDFGDWLVQTMGEGDPPEGMSVEAAHEAVRSREEEFLLLRATLSSEAAPTMRDLAVLGELAAWQAEACLTSGEAVPGELVRLASTVAAAHAAGIEGAQRHMSRSLAHRIANGVPQVIAVGGDSSTAPPTTPFTYTAGLWSLHQHPELIVLGLPMDAAHAILELLIADVRDGRGLSAGETLEVEWAEARFHLADVSSHEASERVTLAPYDRDGREPPVVQIVWPDKNGKMPWQKRYSHPAWHQPSLSDPPRW